MPVITDIDCDRVVSRTGPGGDGPPRRTTMAKTTTGSGNSYESEIKEMFGFVPEFFTALPAAARGDQWAVMRDFGLGETALPHKTRELIGLAVAAHVKCRYCIYFHTESARAFGATDDELREASF